MATQADVLKAQIAVLNNQLEGIELQAVAQKVRLGMQIAQVEEQLAKIDLSNSTS